MDKKIIFGGVLGLLFLGVLVWFLFFRKNPVTGATMVTLPGGQKQPPKPTPTGTNKPQVIYVNSGGNNTQSEFPLRKGSTGANVKALQGKLIALGKLAKGQDDGSWGNITETALKAAGLPTNYADEPSLSKVVNNTDVSLQIANIDLNKIQFIANNKKTFILDYDANIRKTPFGGSEIVKTGKKGDAFFGTGETYVNGNITWVKIKNELLWSNTEGWIYTSAIKNY